MPFDLIVRFRAPGPTSHANYISLFRFRWSAQLRTGAVSSCLTTLVLPSQSGKFIPEKSNIWRDCVDGMHDWVQEHIREVRLLPSCRPQPKRGAGMGVTVTWYQVSAGHILGDPCDLALIYHVSQFLPKVGLSPTFRFTQ